MTGPVETSRRQTPRRPDVSPKPKPEAEAGVSLHLPFVTPYKNAWEILRDDEVTVQQLQAMRKTDGQARALYRLITLPIRAALKSATFLPQVNEEGGEDEAQFVEQLLTLPVSAGGMETPFSKVISQMLMAVFDGFTAFELVYWQPKRGPLKGKWTLKKIAHRPSETLSFLIDNDGVMTGIRQRTMFQGREVDVKIDAPNVAYYAANEEERPFYGESYFQSAFYHWDKKFKLYVISHIACQRAAVGTRVGKMPANPTREEKAAFQKSLGDLGVAQWMTMPDTYTVESLKEGPNFDFLSYINHHNSQMSKSVLAAFFDKEQGGGDSGKLVDFGQQSDALFLLMLQTIMSEIEDVVNNQIIPKFIDWNFNNGKYPRFQFGSLSQEQKGAILDLFKQLAVAGQSLTIRPEFLHETTKVVADDFGLEIDWESIEDEMEEQKLLEEQQQQMQMDMQAAGGIPPEGGIPPGVQLPGPGGPPGGPAGAPAGGGVPMPEIPPKVLPHGFTMLTGERDEATIALTDLARDLLDEAYDEIELARGPLRGPRVVRSAAGARYYGEPIGAQIRWDQEQATAKEGVKGKVFGGGIRGKQDTPGTRQLGGGQGAPGNFGGVVTNPKEAGKRRDVKAFYGNPAAPGAVLIDYGDGTVAIRDANGNLSPRQRFDISRFAALGWKIFDPAEGKAAGSTGGQTNSTGEKVAAQNKDAERKADRATGSDRGAPRIRRQR